MSRTSISPYTANHAVELINSLNSVLAHSDVQHADGSSWIEQEMYEALTEKMQRLINWVESHGFKVLEEEEGQYTLL